MERKVESKRKQCWMVECQHISKTGTIVQLEAQIHQVRCKLHTLQKKKQTNIHQLESSLENLTNKLSNEMNDCKFKLEPQSFTTKVSVKNIDTSNKKRVPIKNDTHSSQYLQCKYDTGHKLQAKYVKRCYYYSIMANWVQKPGVCCPIPCTCIIRTIPSRCYWPWRVIQTITTT